LIWVLTCGGEKTGGRARREPAAVAVGMVTPVSLQSSLSNKRVCKLQRVLGEVWRWLGGGGVKRKGELRVRPTMAERRHSGPAREGEGAALL
jgi:hypothetical protein